MTDLHAHASDRKSGIQLRERADHSAVISRLMAENEALRLENQRLARESRLAYVDHLTGLHNRRYFDERLSQEMSRSLRYRDDLSLIVCDLDDFKRINDTAGHAVGDNVLRFVGYILASSGREFDVACRLGGDEFAILLPGTNAAGAQAVIRRLEHAIAESSDAPVLPKGMRLKLSFGAASAPEAESTSELLIDADAAMYETKRRRKSTPPQSERTAIAA